MSTSATFGLIFFKWAEVVNILGKICAFFGHRDVKYTKELENLLKQEVVKLIEQGYDEFWVCNEGSFDWISRMVMSDVKEEFGAMIYVCYISAYDPDKFSYSFLWCNMEKVFCALIYFSIFFNLRNDLFGGFC